MADNKPTVNKPNNSTMGVPHARRKMMAYFQFSLIALVFVVVFALIYFVSMKKDEKNKIDYSTAELIQFEQPADDAEVVVYETSVGTFKALLYPEQAPEYCEYFKGLVKDGYYDGTYVFAVQDGVYFMGGSKTYDGTDNDDTDKNEVAPELSKDLWPFYGAIAAYGNQKSAFNKQIQAGSRSLFIGSIEFDEATKKELDSASDNKKLNEAFKTHGGVPNFSQQYTIFAQVYDGLDAYADMLAVEVLKPSDSEGGSSDLRPKASVKLEKVYLSTYGENRNDEFFDGGSGGDSDSDSDFDSDSGDVVESGAAE